MEKRASLGWAGGIQNKVAVCCPPKVRKYSEQTDTHTQRKPYYNEDLPEDTEAGLEFPVTKTAVKSGSGIERSV